jgi:hypothetical protein
MEFIPITKGNLEEFVQKVIGGFEKCFKDEYRGIRGRNI